MNKIFIFLGFSLLVVAAIWGIQYQTKKDIANFKLFDKSNLNGTIETVGIKNHGSSFSLKGDRSVYVFNPNSSNDLDGGHSFSNFAIPGDSIIKGAYTDTLYLIKNGNIYKYIFMKIK